MYKTSVIRARIEPGLKGEVEKILSRLGLTVSETIQLFYHQIRLRRGIPFSIEIPNKMTTKTLADSRAGKNVKHFTTKENLYHDLGL